MNQRVQRLTKENATLKAKIQQSEEVQAAMLADLREARRGLADAQVHSSPSQQQSAEIVAPTPAPEKRGGFTDWGQSRVASQPATMHGQDQSVTQQASVMTIGEAPGDPVIRQKCEKEWGTDFRMRAYCEDQQRTAKTNLEARTANSAGVWPNEFTALRNQCAGEWPGDYRMQDYCEQQQITAAKKLRE